MPGFFDAQLPAMFNRSIWGFLRSQATTLDARTTSLGVASIVGFLERLQASSVVFAPGVSVVPNQMVPSLSRTFWTVLAG